MNSARVQRWCVWFRSLVALAALCASTSANAETPADLDGDCQVGAADLATLLGAWGVCGVAAPCPADLTGDGVVGAADLAQLLGAWGSVCCTVEINEAIPFVCVLGSIGYTATANPPGGTFTWTVTQPGAQINPIAGVGDTFTATAENPSAALNDVSIKVVYQLPASTITCEDETELTVVKLKATHIKFDHVERADGSAAAYETANKNVSDGLNITKSFGKDLAHTGNGVGTGEWVRVNPAAPPTRNEPALYVAGNRVSVKARFTIEPVAVASARIQGLSDSGLFSDTEITTIAFNAGVSDPEYTEVFLMEDTPAEVAKEDVTWSWVADRFNGLDVALCLFDDTGPHTLYNVLAVPGAPWYTAGKDNTHPWQSAGGADGSLEFSIVDSGAKTATDVKTAADAITNFVFSGYGLKYDTARGASNFSGLFGSRVALPGSPVGCKKFSPSRLEYEFENFINNGMGKTVNCYDCAAAVMVMTNLVGGRAKFLYMDPFGYIHPTPLIGTNGGANIHNPFPILGGSFTPGVDRVKSSAPAANNRRPFGNHGFVETPVAADRIYDACVGPHLGAETRAQYVTASVDSSTAAETTDPGGNMCRLAGAAADMVEVTDIRLTKP